MKDEPLLENCLGYVNGQWVGAKGGGSSAVHNPATGDWLADVPDMGSEETTEAVEFAALAMDDPAPPDERRRWLQALASLLGEHCEALARIITVEHGKPLRESLAEVDYSAAFFRFFAGQIDHLESRELTESIRNCRWTVYHRPAGVAGLITPWNFPLAMLAKKLSAALAAGCGTVARPPRLAPLSAVAFWCLADQTDIPPGMLNLVPGGAAAIGKVLCEHPLVRVVSFTGSTKTGQILAAQTASHVKRLAMELGGNAPFIVFEDADLEAAADGLIANKFRAGGQTCVCANRVYVHRDVERAFVDLLAPRVAALKVGNGLDEQTDVGPLINLAAFDKVAGHVDEALARGAERLVGNDPERPREDWGCFYPPTLLTGAQQDMRVFREETFGPVVAVATFDSEDDVIRLANDTSSGLAGYAFTRDASRARRCADGLRFGHIGLNTGTGPAPQAPFGGMKQSGFGREGGLEGLFEFCEPQTVASA